MKFTIPFSLRRSLFAGFFMSLSASAADYTVDASQTSDPGRKVYQTLAELASAGVLAAGDTVILNNDDSSLTSKLPVLVNFRSNDPETPRTVDLSGLGNTPLFSPAKGNYTLEYGIGRFFQCSSQSIFLQQQLQLCSHLLKNFR